jgi:hypothetical protein
MKQSVVRAVRSAKCVVVVQVHGASTRFKQREVVLATGGNPALVEKTVHRNHTILYI